MWPFFLSCIRQCVQRIAVFAVYRRLQLCCKNNTKRAKNADFRHFSISKMPKNRPKIVCKGV
nr:MAG TPA: hypothetical protein [Caudoviricetes sp.]